MNREELGKGDLVHIPASVYFLKFENQALNCPPTTTLLNDKPTIGVIIDRRNDIYTEVFCRGARWSVRSDKLYKVKAGSLQ